MARAPLRRSLSYLRKSLGEGVLVTRGNEEVGIAAGAVECDALEFEASLDRGDLESGWRLYGGPLLDGLFVVGASGTGTRLFARSMDDGRLTPLEGTEGAFGPFFSPDGAWVGFFAQGHLMRVASDGTRVQPLLETGAPLGGSWADDGRIAAAIKDGRTLAVLPAGGGSPDFLPAEGTVIADPFWVPSTEWILLTCYDPKTICAMSTAGELRHLTLDGEAVGRPEGARLLAGASPRFVAPGYLVYSAPSRNALLGVRFDPETLRIRGEPDVVYDGVRREAFLGAAQAAITGC